MPAIAAAIVLGVAGGAAAHNDRTVFAGPVGPYDLTASVQYLHGAEEGLELDVAVRTQDRRPIDEGTTVTVSAASGADRAGPLAAERFGSTYRVTLPSVQGATWQATVTVAGPVGETSVDVAVPVDDLRADSGGHADPAPEELSNRRWVAPAVALAVVAYVLWDAKNRRQRSEGEVTSEAEAPTS